MKQEESLFPVDFQGKKTSFGSPLSQRVSFEALFQTQVFLKSVKNYS